MRFSWLGSNKFIGLYGTLAQSVPETLKTHGSPSPLPCPSGSGKSNENSEDSSS